MNLGRLLNSSVTIASESGVSSYGDPAFGSQSAISARVETHLEREIARPDGTTEVSTATVYTASQIPVGARVWLPGTDTGDATASRVVLSSGSSSRLRDASTVLYKAEV